MEVEVICISSDDEPNLPKKDKTDKILTNSIDDSIRALVHKKTKTLSSDNEKVEKNNLKRKKLQTDEDKIWNTMEKRKRLNSDQSRIINKPVSDLCSIDIPEIHCVKSDYETQPIKNQEVTIEKTQLIVKMKKKISYVPQDVFPSFITLCLQKCPEHDKMDMDKIVDKLKRRYENLDSTYAKSEDFFLFLNEKRKAVINDHKKIYTHIQELMNEMKKNIKKKSQALQNNEIYDTVPSTSYANNASVCNGVESDNDEDDDDNEDSDSEKRRRIQQVLSTMKKCEAVIKRLEEEEVDFDDENNSNYIKVEKYKQRMVDLYNKLCELTGENADAGRVYLRPKYLNVTQIISVDQAITNFINSKITRQNRIKKKECLTDDLIFPDYRDILECINKCNKNKNLGLDEGKQKQIAEKAFKELGEHLQRTRRNDYWDTFSMYLENTEDPATRDKNLARKLSDNRTEGEKRLAAVFEKYTQKQLEIKNQDNEETTSEEEDEDDDEEEEEEEEEEDDDDDEKKQIDVIDDKNKNNQNLCTTSEKSGNEDINKTIKENRLSMEKNKSDISMTNVHHIIANAMSNKTVADSVQEKCNKTVKIKLVRMSDLAVSKNEDKTTNEKMTHRSCNSNITNDMQKNSPTGSTTNCTKDLTKVETLEISKAVTNSEAKKVTKDVEDTVTQITSELITRDAELIVADTTEFITGNIVEDIPEYTAEDITRNTAELTTRNTVELTTRNTAELIIEDTTELITKDITVTENTVEVMTDETKIITENVIDGAIDNMPNEEQPEEEKKPLLRCRSFAKPPTTWEDSQHKLDKIAQENMPNVTNQIKEIVDLTNEGTAKSSPIITKCAVQFKEKVVPIVKQTLIIPAINVQNITNNYLKVNTRTGQIIASVRRNIGGSTINKLPSMPSTSQQNPQNVNATTVKKNVLHLKRITPKIVISKNSTMQQSVPKQTDMSSLTKSK